MADKLRSARDADDARAVVCSCIMEANDAGHHGRGCDRKTAAVALLVVSARKAGAEWMRERAKAAILDELTIQARRIAIDAIDVRKMS